MTRGLWCVRADRLPDGSYCGILTAARASFPTNRLHLAIAELTSWPETGPAIAAGPVQEAVEWLDDSETVERPRSVAGPI